MAHLEETDRGMEWVSRALTLEPEDAQSYHNLGRALAHWASPITTATLCSVQIPTQHQGSGH